MVKRSFGVEAPPAPPAPNRSEKPIDMVLHCPSCGMQHIDRDNSEEIRIQAAELGVDREGAKEYERWLDDNEWTNPPHRSHLCHGCGHVWRPADVPTNGVVAVKTKGKADSAIAPTRVSKDDIKQEWHDKLDCWHRLVNTKTGSRTIWAPYTQWVFLDGFVGHTAYFGVKENIVTAEQFCSKANGIKVLLT